MNVSDCKVNCELLQAKNVGSFGKSRNYRCMSEKAPEKKGQNTQEYVSGYLIRVLKKCPEGYV